MAISWHRTTTPITITININTNGKTNTNKHGRMALWTRDGVLVCGVGMDMVMDMDMEWVPMDTDTGMDVNGFMGRRYRFLLWGLHRRIIITGKEDVGGLARLIYLFSYLVTFSQSMNTVKSVNEQTNQ